VGSIQSGRMIRRVLFAADRSTYCRLAADNVAALASQLGAELILLHVVEVPIGVDASSFEDRGEGPRLLASMQERLVGAGVTTTPVGIRGARVGRVAEEIIDVAAFYDVQLIVMGSKGESDLRGLLLGSTTHRVLQLAPCPVVVVPPSRGSAGERRR
jgi:nucleotide-binding universal stress UspA family protein